MAKKSLISSLANITNLASKKPNWQPCSVVFRNRHRENRETISIVKPQLLPVFWLAHYISVCVT